MKAVEVAVFLKPNGTISSVNLPFPTFLPFQFLLDKKRASLLIDILTRDGMDAFTYPYDRLLFQTNRENILLSYFSCFQEFANFGFFFF